MIIKSALSVLAGLVPLAGEVHSQTYQHPTFVSGASGSACNALLRYPSGIPVNFQVASPAVTSFSVRDTAANGKGAFGTQTLGLIGAGPSAMFTNAPKATASVLLDTGSSGCAFTVNISIACGDREAVILDMALTMSALSKAPSPDDPNLPASPCSAAVDGEWTTHNMRTGQQLTFTTQGAALDTSATRSASGNLQSRQSGRCRRWRPIGRHPGQPGGLHVAL